jgi:hypothetical protein
MSYTSLAVCHLLSILSSEPNLNQITRLYSSIDRVLLLMISGNDSLFFFEKLSHGAEGFYWKPICRKATCSSTTCLLRVLFE